MQSKYQKKNIASYKEERIISTDLESNNINYQVQLMMQLLGSPTTIRSQSILQSPPHAAKAEKIYFIKRLPENWKAMAKLKGKGQQFQG